MSHRHTLDIPYVLSRTGRDGLQATLAFVDPAIRSFCIEPDGRRVTIDLCGDCDTDRILQKVRVLVDKHRPARKDERNFVLFDQTGLGVPCQRDMYGELVARGDVFEHGPGIVSLSGNMLSLCRALDRRLLEFASSQEARDVELPITTSLKTLNQADFFQRTPQFAQFMCTLREDSDKILDFAAKVSEADRCEAFADCLNPPQCMCRSAICLSSYPMFQGRTLTPLDFSALTVFGKAFRNEAANVATLERLYEFSMRELIFVGDKEYVAARLDRCVRWFIGFMESCQIKGTIEAASDPFFAQEIKALRFYQLAEQAKFEVRWHNPWSGNSVSVGSINNHGTHFSKAYNIRLADGRIATTGCVGFGYERFVFLVLSQYGWDRDQWPEALREFWSC